VRITISLGKRRRNVRHGPIFVLRRVCTTAVQRRSAGARFGLVANMGAGQHALQLPPLCVASEPGQRIMGQRSRPEHGDLAIASDVQHHRAVVLNQGRRSHDHDSSHGASRSSKRHACCNASSISAFGTDG
jgi:hypothetical protein